MLKAEIALGCNVREDIVLADLSIHTIGINSDFSGDHVLFFGATECPGDVVIIVRGPQQRMLVSQKTRVAGIWVNGKDITFEAAPVLYAVAATRPLEEILSPEVRGMLGIGVDYLRLDVEEEEDADRLALFREAFIQNRQERGLYTLEPVRISKTGEKLFRTSVWFPPNVPTGEYIADLYYVRDGAIVGSYILPLSVEKTGFEGKLYNFAHDMPAAYGAVAIALAVFSGWLIGLVFGKR